MATAGLLYIQSRPKPGFDEEKYNEWYSNYHIQDVIQSGLADVGIRYKNTKPDAKWPYLAIYRMPDIAKIQDKAVLESIPAKHDLLPNGGPWHDALEIDTRAFVLLQKFEGQIPKDGKYVSHALHTFFFRTGSSQSPKTTGPRGKALRTVLVEPGNDEDFDDWYRKQHLDMLSMVPGFRRSTRYKLADPMNASGSPRFLACHEYDTTEFPADAVKLVTGTEWSKKVLSSAKGFEADVWEEIAVTGATESKL
jgi:hypothetical protein